jgi:carbon storage regulator CsrA
MLVITRRQGERILIGDVELVVVETRRRSVRLAIAAPKGTRIVRAELAEKVPSEGGEPPAGA